MTRSGPVLGLDYGARRIGVAVSDAEGRFAFPVAVLERSGGRRDLAALRALVEERGAVRVVVGLPLHLDGRAGPEAEAARAFAREVGEATGLPVELLDERWTTQEARRAVRDSEPRRRRRRAPVDDAAATLLLRTWLQRREAAGEAE